MWTRRSSTSVKQKRFVRTLVTVPSKWRLCPTCVDNDRGISYK